MVLPHRLATRWPSSLIPLAAREILSQSQTEVAVMMNYVYFLRGYIGNFNSTTSYHIYIYDYYLFILVTVKWAVAATCCQHTCCQNTGFGAYSSICCKGTGNCAGTMGVDQLPSSTIGLQTLDNANDDKRPSGHIAALTFHDEFVQKYINVYKRLSQCKCNCFVWLVRRISIQNVYGYFSGPSASFYK